MVKKGGKRGILLYENGWGGGDVVREFLGDGELKSIMWEG